MNENEDKESKIVARVKEVEDSVSLLEKKYISFTRLISSKNVELEQKRNEVRKQRQKVLEHERQIEMYKIRINKKQDRYKTVQETITQYQAARKEVNELQVKLAALSKMTENQKVDYEMFLYDKYENYKKILNQLLIRKKCAKDVLKREIDNVIFEEIESNQLEDEVEAKVELETYTEEKEIEDLQEIQELCTSNDIRRKALENKAALLKEESKKCKSLKIKNDKVKQVVKTDLPPAVNADAGCVDDDIQKIIDSITKRRKKITMFNDKTKSISESYEKKRSEIETLYNDKAKVAAKYKKRMSNVQSLRQLIDDMYPKIKNAKNKLADLESSRERIKRRIENILRDKDSNTKRKTEIEQLMNNYEKRKMEFLKFVALFEQKKKEYDAQVLSFSQRETEVSTLEERVIKLENEVKNLEGKTQAAICELKKLSLETDAVKESYANAFKDNSGPKLSEEIHDTFA